MPDSLFQPSSVFFGTPDFAATCLQAMIDGGVAPTAVVSMPDTPTGRGRKIRPSAVSALAAEHGLPLFQPYSLRTGENAGLFKQLLNADIAVVVAYGLLIPEPVLSMPRYGCINVHASLLPRWRGAAPIQRAILAGDSTTGISIMQMERGLDTGPVLRTASCPIGSTDTGGSLHDTLAELGAQQLLSTLTDLPQLTAQPQDGQQANYADKIHKSDGAINWQQSTQHIDQQIRAFNPTPVAWTLLDGLRIRIWSAVGIHDSQTTNTEPGTIMTIDGNGFDVATADGTLRVSEIQLPGKSRMSVQDLVRGNNKLLQPGTRFSFTSGLPK